MSWFGSFVLGFWGVLDLKGYTVHRLQYTQIWEVLFILYIKFLTLYHIFREKIYAKKTNQKRTNIEPNSNKIHTKYKPNINQKRTKNEPKTYQNVPKTNQKRTNNEPNTNQKRTKNKPITNQ